MKKQHLGQQLKEALERKGISIVWTAKHLGISRTMLYRNFENGAFTGSRKKKVETLIKLKL